jgi:molybdopterin molybdotransferase
MSRIISSERLCRIMEHTKGFQNLTKIDDALRVFLDAISEPKTKSDLTLIENGLGRFLATDVVSRRSLPPVDISTMDGYAVRAEDVEFASEQNPVILKVIGESKLGSICRLTVRSGQAVAIATGSMVPSGADSIAIVEQTKPISRDKVAAQIPSVKGQSITRKGEDVAPGQIVLSKGRRLRPEDIGILRALGVAKVQLAREPRVAIISTGNELTNTVNKNTPAKVVDINRPILVAMLRTIGAQPVDLGIVSDNAKRITSVLKKGLLIADAVLVTAGSSVGRRDLVPRCIEALGKPGMLVHGVAMRPGLPTGLAVVRGKPVVSLPGFPVSALVAFRIFVRPLIARLSGLPQAADPTVKAVLSSRISGGRGWRTFVRVAVRREQTGLIAEPLRSQKSSALTSMVNANGIVTIPESQGGYEAGQEVDVSLVGEI